MASEICRASLGAGMVDLKVVTFAVIFSGLCGAIIWSLFTWYVGLPTSSSHALFGGYAGAAVAKAGAAKRGWYKDSADTISNIFGPDAPRFSALLAALSPRTTLNSNLENAVNVWAGWVEAGRPADRSGRNSCSAPGPVDG